MERRNYIIAVDLGSSNVTVAVGEQPEEGGPLEVVYIVRKPSEGVNAGQIENSELAGNAIHAAIEEVEQALGCRITEVYAGISGEFVRCACDTDHVYIGNPHDGVSHADVESLHSRMRNVQAPAGETIMERIPQSYSLDGTREVKNPVGSFGTTLSATFNFVLCDTVPLQRLEMVLKRHGITIKKIFPSVLATPEAVLSPDEKADGVAVIDIGGGVTDITVYYRDVVRYVASIPMGAAAINRDIRTLGIPEKYVELLKLEKGSAVPELTDNNYVKVPGRKPRDEKKILKRNLAMAIEARMLDLIEFVMQELKDSKFGSKLAYGIVLTGGSAALKDLDTLFNRETKMDVRVAVPDIGISEASQQLVDSPAYATVTGLLLRGAAHGASSLIVENPPVRTVVPTGNEADASETAVPESIAAPHTTASQHPRTVSTPAGKTPTSIPPRRTAEPSTVGSTQRPKLPVVPEEPDEPLPPPDTFKHIPPKQPKPAPASEPTSERTAPRTIRTIYDDLPVSQPPVDEPTQPDEDPVVSQPKRKTINDLYGTPSQPGHNHEPEPNPEADARAEERSGRIKESIITFLNKINGKWDKSSEFDEV